MRKLVTLRTVNKISPIKGADKLELATIDGWNCVCKIGEFKEGDIGVFFEIDSLIPAVGTFEFLAARNAQHNHGGVHFDTLTARIKTTRLRGELSQGLLLPTRLFSDIDFSQYTPEDDLSELFGVTKYEPYIPSNLRGKATGLFPSFCFKSDQQRVQNLTNVRQMSIDEGLDYEVTLKLNGCSMTVFYQTCYGDNDRGVCSRNFQLQLDQELNHYIDLQNRDHIIEKLIDYHSKTGKNYAVQGELVGMNIQGNYEKFNELRFFVFDVFDIETQLYLPPAERRKVVDELGLNHVPVLYTNFNLNTFSEENFMKEILKFAEGPSINHDVREGVCFKSNQPYMGRVYTFKAVSNLYLKDHDTD